MSEESRPARRLPESIGEPHATTRLGVQRFGS
jgi:hypothetical protein